MGPREWPQPRAPAEAQRQVSTSRGPQSRLSPPARLVASSGRPSPRPIQTGVLLRRECRAARSGTAGKIKSPALFGSRSPRAARRDVSPLVVVADDAEDLQIRESRAASASDWPRCAPCFPAQQGRRPRALLRADLENVAAPARPRTVEPTSEAPLFGDALAAGFTTRSSCGFATDPGSLRRRGRGCRGRVVCRRGRGSWRLTAAQFAVLRDNAELRRIAASGPAPDAPVQRRRDVARALGPHLLRGWFTRISQP